LYGSFYNQTKYYLCSAGAASPSAAGAASVEAAAAESTGAASGAASGVASIAVESAAGAVSSVFGDEHDVANVIAATANVTLNKFFIFFVIIINNMPLIPLVLF
jgi:hypothetical protein